MSIILLSYLKTQLSMMGIVFVSFTMTFRQLEPQLEGAEFEARPIPVEPAEEKEDE